jgi:DNA adenine methylase
MVIGATPFIRELYDGYIVDEFEKKYAFKLHSGRVGSEINTTHLVITNYASGSSRSTTDIKNDV